MPWNRFYILGLGKHKIWAGNRLLWLLGADAERPSDAGAGPHRKARFRDCGTGTR